MRPEEEPNVRLEKRPLGSIDPEFGSSNRLINGFDTKWPGIFIDFHFNFSFNNNNLARSAHTPFLKSV